MSSCLPVPRAYHIAQARRKDFLSGQAILSLFCRLYLEDGVREHAKTRGVWGDAPPGKFWGFKPLRELLVTSRSTILEDKSTTLAVGE